VGGQGTATEEQRDRLQRGYVGFDGRARRVAAAMPAKVTLERMTAKSKPRTVAISYVQIGRGKTMVPPFVVRARPQAPVSMPIAWSDVESLRGKRSTDTGAAFSRWTIRNVPRLLAAKGDPWQGEVDKEQRIDGALKKARRLWKF